MQADKLIQELPKGLIKWYDFQEGNKALFVSGGAKELEVLQKALKESGLKVQCASPVQLLSTECSQNEYDYILLAGVLERTEKPVELLQVLYTLLSPSGKLLLAIDNRLGIRYFCGDRDHFTERNFDSIENYVKVGFQEREKMGGRAYARAEIVQILEAAGFSKHRFYSVLPELSRPQALYAGDYLPEEELDVRIIPQYHSPDTIFLEEERLYTTLIQNGLFHAMANGYLVECPRTEDFADVRQVTVSMDRGEKHALLTIIRQNIVEKRPLYAQGYKKLEELVERAQYLREHGIKVVDGKLWQGAYIMPYVKGEPATDYLRRLLLEDKSLFLQELDRFWHLILNSSEHVALEDINWEHFDPDWKKRRSDDPTKDKWKKIAYGNATERENFGVILERGYIDLVSLNCFYIDGEFIFYDQEFYQKHLPANVILIRTINFIYWGNTEMEAVLPREQLLERYHLKEYQQLWHRFSDCFIRDLRSEKELSAYHQLCRRDAGIIEANRFRMNYSENEYERIFKNIFDGVEGRKLYLFGSGIYAKHFLEDFASDYPVAGILDNNSGRWGEKIDGVPILSPEILQSLDADEYKIIICIKYCVPVIRQLRELGVQNYSVYDWHQEYPRKLPVIVRAENTDTSLKKYHVGYIAGVFDLYHIGHLNMFRRAKEQCEYLIVGVVSDEGVMLDKKTMPCIPFEERIELVRSCRYVDEAIELLVGKADTYDVYRKYHFDVQFSGSDYEHDPDWLAKKAFLRKRGADLVFFPYTQTTSSTKIKGVIEKKLS